ncbi:MAG TPA: ScbR family autoregulator-binding transcription factor [Actinophytocola sp.]|uniref:ScbR family autoregulator-binding transcription factor n=1 Tax=Actinophytocola sp. TaxID=1872138 RepID=UPI002DDD7498|nr:ScbR family autoregulator-binding transcription factor [Actinophytocola sp.]HEV2780666.1 ScbR family autoregulator-binding transcription factor [Actinophytocola sp.]
MPRQDRAERTRNAILDAAAEVFDERGFNGASLSDILTRAGVTKGALYFHFTSKEELARAIIDEQFTVPLPFVDFDNLTLQTLIDMSHALAYNLRENVRVRASVRLVVESNFANPSPEAYDRWIKMATDVLTAAQERGDLRKELDPEDVANWTSAVFLGIQTQSEVLTRREDIHERLTFLWRIALPGLVPSRRLARFVPSGTGPWSTSAAATA